VSTVCWSVIDITPNVQRKMRARVRGSLLLFVPNGWVSGLDILRSGLLGLGVRQGVNGGVDDLPCDVPGEFTEHDAGNSCDTSDSHHCSGVFGREAVVLRCFVVHNWPSFRRYGSHNSPCFPREILDGWQVHHPPEYSTG